MIVNIINYYILLEYTSNYLINCCVKFKLHTQKWKHIKLENSKLLICGTVL